MSVESLGMIEVRGYLGAVVAADAALKAADVDLQDVQITSGGLTTVLLRGDVSAVNASVDAGVSSIDQLGCLISQHVISRLDGQVDEMTTPPKNPTDDSDKNADTSNAEETDNDDSKKSLTKNVSAANDLAKKDEIKPNWVTSREKLEKMKVTELRHQAYQMNLQTMSKAQIKMGSKNNLIKAILSDIERRRK